VDVIEELTKRAIQEGNGDNLNILIGMVDRGPFLLTSLMPGKGYLTVR
jgi:hypothetical protein